jgi:hypothetical protein
MPSRNIPESKYQLMFDEAQADAIRFRKERDQALEDLRVTQSALGDEKATVARQQRRIDDLLRANNAELEKRRKFETEANQEYCERLLLRQECIRLREAHSVLASHIEEAHGNADEAIPDELSDAMNAVFPEAANAVA